MTSPRMQSLCWYTAHSKWPFSCADKHFSGDIFPKGKVGRSSVHAHAEHWLAASSHLERWGLEMLVIHQPHFRAAIFVCRAAWGKRGRDPLLPNPGWSFPLFSQRTRSCKLLECIKPHHKLFAEAKDVTQIPLTRGQDHLFLSSFSKHRKASTLWWWHVHLAASAGSSSLCRGWVQKPCYFILLCLANLSPAWWEQGEECGPAASCDLLQEVHGQVTSQEQGSHVSTVATPSALRHLSKTAAQSSSRTTSATKDLCSSLWGGALFNFHSFLAQLGSIVLHITFCSRKTTTVQRGKRAPGCADQPVLRCTELDKKLRDLLSEWAAQRAQTFVWQSAETGLGSPRVHPLPFTQSVWLKATALLKQKNCVTWYPVQDSKTKSFYFH